MNLFKNPTFDLEIYTDGGARHNPGPAGIGAVFKDPASGKIIFKLKQFIGTTTNNCAEYKAVIASLVVVKKFKAKKIKILSDSELLVKQMQGLYKVKDEKLKKLHLELKNISRDFEIIFFEHINRENNNEADLLVNEASEEFFNKNRLKENS